MYFVKESIENFTHCSTISAVRRQYADGNHAHKKSIKGTWRIAHNTYIKTFSAGLPLAIPSG